MTVYVRSAVLPDEFQEVVDLYTRGYADSPSSNYWGSVDRTVSHYDINQLPKGSKDYRVLKRLRAFQEQSQSLVCMHGGIVLVVVDKADDGTEKIVGVSTWLPPNVTVDANLGELAKIKAWRFITRGLGFTGYYRIMMEFTPKVEKSKDKAFKAKGLDKMDAWRLFTIVVEPGVQSKGYGAMMVKEGLSLVSSTSKPVHLEAGTERAMMLYKRYGFETDEIHRYGVGKVDENGLKAKGEKAVGFQEWMMYKWT